MKVISRCPVIPGSTERVARVRPNSGAGIQSRSRLALAESTATLAIVLAAFVVGNTATQHPCAAQSSAFEMHRQVLSSLAFAGQGSSLAFLQGLNRGSAQFWNVNNHQSRRSGSRCKSTAAVDHMRPQASPLSFVPPEGEGKVEDAAKTLRKFFHECGDAGVVVITGAGVSTESGIPDYRSPKGSYSTGHKPIQHDEFVFSESHRKRNDGHRSIALLQKHGAVDTVITQNVDALHQKAGTRHVIDLHGRNDLVACLSCGASMPRSSFHERYLEPLNPAWAPRPEPSQLENRAQPGPDTVTARAPLRPDGDAAVETDFSSFNVPACPSCGDGVVKPEVVFFGDVVPQRRKEDALHSVLNASGLLVAGSSLSTLSAFRLVDGAVKHGVPVAVLNIGPTRAEARGLPVLKIEEQCGPVLSRVAAAVAQGPGTGPPRPAAE